MDTLLDESESGSSTTPNGTGHHDATDSRVSESELRTVADYCMQAYIVLEDAAHSFAEPYQSAVSSAHASAKTCFDRLSSAADQHGNQYAGEYSLAPARECAFEARQAIERVTNNAEGSGTSVQSVFFALRTLARVEQRIHDLSNRSN